MAGRGQAADYYNGIDGPAENDGYKMQQPMNYQQNGGQQNQNGQNYNDPPPSYSYGEPFNPQQNMNTQGGDKPTFAQAFKIDKPKWNDLWAGILLILVFAGFVAVSAISIKGYCTAQISAHIFPGSH